MGFLLGFICGIIFTFIFLAVFAKRIMIFVAKKKISSLVGNLQDNMKMFQGYTAEEDNKIDDKEVDKYGI